MLEVEAFPLPMKPPPFLLGAALLFWGWQSGLLVVGAIMAGVLESARFIKVRWEFSDDDLSRIWTFCSLLVLAAVVYAFTSNDGPASFSNFFQNPTGGARAGAGVSTARTSAALFRWLPMLFFLFVAAQTYNTRETFPLAAISMILRRRWRKAKERGEPTPADRPVAIGYPYFASCLLAAGVHEAGTDRFNSFFWGVCVLLAYGLWAQRSRRFNFLIWAGALALAIGLGFAGQRGVGQLLGLVQNLNVQWLARLMRQSSDAEQSRTALGRVGELKQSPRIVVRLELPDGRPPPQYLREASYRSYGYEVWRSGAGTNGFETVPETPLDSAIWPLVPGKTNFATVRIASFLDGWKDGQRAALLPLPRTSGRLENLKAFTVEKNSNGAVLATGPGLVVFDALYGPGGTIDSPPDTGATRTDLSAPQSNGVPANSLRTRTVAEDGGGLSFAGLASTNEDFSMLQLEAQIQEQGDEPHRYRADPEMMRRIRERYTNMASPTMTNVPQRYAVSTGEDLGVPPREAPAIAQIVSELGIEPGNLKQALLKLSEFFGDTNRFAYSTWQRPSRRSAGTNETPLSRFLLKTRKGHCEYFATATVLLLRQAGIPARYVVGYAVHEGSGRKYVVRQRDAHAWCLVWNAQRSQWQDFDTTPASWVTQESRGVSSMLWLADAWARVRYEIAKVWWGQTKLRQYILWSLGPVLVLLLYQIIFRRGRKRRGGKPAKADLQVVWPGLDSEFFLLEERLAEHGVPRAPSEALSAWLERAATNRSDEVTKTLLRDLLRLHYRYRFDPAGLAASERAVLREQARACLKALTS